MQMNADAIMDMLKNKEQVLTMIMKDLETSDKNMKAFQGLEQLYKDGKEVSSDKVLKATATSLRHLNEANRRILTLLIVYMSGSSYDEDLGRTLIKMGRGEDALKEMFANKLRGK